MTIQESLAKKLHPSVLQVSSQFHAVLACLVGENWTRPRIVELAVTSDDVVWGVSERMDREFISTLNDLLKNIEGVCATVHATPEERAYLLERARLPFCSSLMPGEMEQLVQKVLSDLGSRDRAGDQTGRCDSGGERASDWPER